MKLYILGATEFAQSLLRDKITLPLWARLFFKSYETSVLRIAKISDFGSVVCVNSVRKNREFGLPVLCSSVNSCVHRKTKSKGLKFVAGDWDIFAGDWDLFLSLFGAKEITFSSSMTMMQMHHRGHLGHITSFVSIRFVFFGWSRSKF